MIRYSGSTIVDRVYVSDGTKPQMITQIRNALADAGWNNVSGGIYETATTPGGHKIRVEVYDAGLGCVYCQLRSDVLVQGGARGHGDSIFPVNGRPFRIWANKYQFFHYCALPIFTTDPVDVAAGVLYIPPFVAANLQDAYNGWLVGNGIGEFGDSGNSNNSFTFRGWWKFDNPAGLIIWDKSTYYSTGGGQVSGLIWQVVNLASGVLYPEMWEDGTIAVYEPYMIICGGHTMAGNWANAIRHGQLWDALIYGVPQAPDRVRTIDGKPWRNIKVDWQPGGSAIRQALMLLTN